MGVAGPSRLHRSDADTLEYYVVDVFTDEAFAGNPLAVVLGADDLPDRHLQQLAAEFNLQETAFPLPPSGAAGAVGTADYRLRIFTPVGELPFAGHPSVGSAWLLHRLGRLPAGPATQECGAGLLPVEITEAGGAVSVTLHGGTPSVSPEIDPTTLLDVLGLSTRELAGMTGRPAVASAGLPFVYLAVAEGAVQRAGLQVEPVTALTRSLGAEGLCVFSVMTSTDVEPRETIHSRVLAGGVGEDPATGSAALGLGVWLIENGHGPGYQQDGELRYTVHQGAELGRPSVLECTVVTRDGRVADTQVKGSAVPIAQGRITRPG